MSDNEFLIEAFQHRVQLRFESFERSFEIQEWCVEKFGEAEVTGAWALGYGGDNQYQSWYFAEGKNATLFKLRWL